MELSSGQRSGLLMISRGFRPKTVTVEALFAKQLLTGSLKSPRLNGNGQHFVSTGELPTALLKTWDGN